MLARSLRLPRIVGKAAVFGNRLLGSRARDHWDLWDTVRPKPTTALDDYTFDVTLRTKDGSLLHSGKLLPMIKVDERFISFDGRSPSAAGGRVRWVRLVSLPLPRNRRYHGGSEAY